MRKKIIKIMSDVLELPQGDIDENVSPETCEDWDSLLHISLVIKLEKQFQVTFLPEEVGELICLEAIFKIIKNKTEDKNG